MKFILAAVAIFYGIGVVGTFWLHTQMPVTLGLALLRSALWPWWMLGGLHGSPLPMD